ncbi:MAG: hypothetical protein PHN60_01265 [Candidatus Gracilibacteria bacterium]|nr:hypothetical protein [Candidatus Gracilibacteria bacterium]
MVQSIGTGTGLISLRLTTYDTSGETRQLFESGGTRVFSFSHNIQKRWYKISGTTEDMVLNSSVMQYYNLTNRNNTPENEIRLIKIVGGNGMSYASLTIQNVLGSKVIMGSGTNLEKATLTFEKNGKEMSLVVTMDGVIYH